MTLVVLGETTGWLILALMAVTVSLPYLLRGRLLAPGGWTIPYVQRMQPHYWIGFTIAGLGLVHAGFAMSAPLSLTSTSFAGLWIATGGMFLAAGQALIGMQLRVLRGRARLRLRKVHFGVMSTLVVIGLLHIVLNGVVVRGLLG